MLFLAVLLQRVIRSRTQKDIFLQIAKHGSFMFIWSIESIGLPSTDLCPLFLSTCCAAVMFGHWTIGNEWDGHPFWQMRSYDIPKPFWFTSGSLHNIFKYYIYIYTISYSTGSWHSMLSYELMMSVRQNSEMGEPYHLEHPYVYTLYYQCI